MVSDDALEQLIEIYKSQSDDWGIAQDTALALAELQAHRARLAQATVVDLEGFSTALLTLLGSLERTGVNIRPSQMMLAGDVRKLWMSLLASLEAGVQEDGRIILAAKPAEEGDR